MIRDKIAQAKARLNLEENTLELFDDDTEQWLPLSSFSPLNDDDLECLKDNYGMLFEDRNLTRYDNSIVDMIAQNKIRFNMDLLILEYLNGPNDWMPLYSLNLGRPLSETEIETLRANYPSDVIDRFLDVY